MAMLRHTDDRDLGFQLRFRLTEGTLTLNGSQVGQVTTGLVTVPIRAYFRPYPPPGGYIFDLPQVRGGLPDEIIVETIGYLNVNAIAQQLTLPPAWKVIPEELLDDLTLDARLVFEAVGADDEYSKNEPGDLDEARKRYDGSWRLSCPFDLGFSLDLDAGEVSLDRREFELATERVTLQEVT